MSSQQIQQISQIQRHIAYTPTLLNNRSNSLQSLNKGDLATISSTKQPTIPSNTQAISFKPKPAINTSPMDQIGKLINANSVASNNTFFSSSSNNISNSASKSKNQYTCQQQSIGSIQPPSIGTIQGQSTLSTNRLNISIGSTGQSTYQYNQTRSRPQSNTTPFNQNVQVQSDIQRISYALNSDINQLKLSILTKENDSNPQSSQSFIASQHIKQIQSPMSNGSFINQQKQFSQQQLPLQYQTQLQKQQTFQQVDKKVDNPLQPQILTQNQNHLNQIQTQTQSTAKIQQENNNCSNNNVNAIIPPQFKDSTIQFITSSDLENELKDLASILHREREGGQTVNTNNFLQTDRESQTQEQKLEIELLKEQNDVLRKKVDELVQFQVEYDKEQQQIYLEKNLALKQSQDENESLYMKFQKLEKAQQIMQDQIVYNKQVIPDTSLNIYGQQTPKSLKTPFDPQTHDMSSNIDLQDALEKKLLYLEDKMRDDEIQRNKLQLVVIKQEESVTLLETMVREAQDAQKNAEQKLNEKQYILKQKDMEIADLQSIIEVQKIEMVAQKNKIDILKTDLDAYLNNDQEIEKVKATKKSQEQESISLENIELIEKIKVLESNVVKFEKELQLKQQEINSKQQEINSKQQDINSKQAEINSKQLELNSKQQEINTKSQDIQNKQLEINKIQDEKEIIERESLILSKNTNALSDKVLQLQASLEKNSIELKSYEKRLQEQTEQSQEILNQKLNNQRSNYELIITQLNEKTIGLQDQLKRVNLILDSSSINFEVSQKEIIREKNEAFNKINKLIKEEAFLQKQIEESKISKEELKIKLSEQTSYKECLSIELDKLRNDISEQRRIFQETQKNLNNHIDQLIIENNNLKQIQLSMENDTGNKLNQIIQILQQEKIQLLQDNKNIIYEKTTLNEKIRQLQQTNTDLLNNQHKTENEKNLEIEELKKENAHFENNIKCLKEQINAFIVEIKQFQVQLDTIRQESRLKTEQIHSQENLIFNQKSQIEELIQKSYVDQETGRYYHDQRFKEIEEEKKQYVEKYEKVQQNLVSLEDKLSLIIQQLNSKNEQISCLENNIQSLLKEKEQILVDNNNCYKEISRLNAESREVEKKLITLQENLSDSQKISQNYKNEANKIKEAHSNLLQEKDRVIQEQQQKLKNSSIEINEKSLILEDISFEIQKQKDFQSIISNLKKEKEILELEQIKLLKDNEVLRIHLIQKQPDNCQIEQILQEHNDMLTQYHQEILRLKDKLQQKQQIVDKFTNKIQKQSQKILEDEKEIQNLSQFISIGKKQYEKTIEDQSQKIDRMERQYTSEQITLNNQIHLLMQDKQQLKLHLDQIQKEMAEFTSYQRKINTLPSAK